LLNSELDAAQEKRSGGAAMKPNQKDSFHRPFSRLQDLVEKKQMSLAPVPDTRPLRQPRLTHRQENELFARAMDDVTPLSHNRHWQLPESRLACQAAPEGEEADCVCGLRRLVRTGQGFIIAQTGEYMEACCPGVDPAVTEQLHQGRYSIQDYIDLHGLLAHEAEPVLRRFIQESARRGCRAVLVIHGRGLKSPDKPVLKRKVFDWLTRGSLRAYVMALATARACDGGAGATYVLLRRRPIGKKRRKSPSHPGPGSGA
jgi:DNA-nicking Smr family endonuclease